MYKRQYDSSKEDIVFIAPLMDVEKHKLIFGTKSAMIKLVDGAEFVVTRKTVSYTHLVNMQQAMIYMPTLLRILSLSHTRQQR